MNAKDIGAGDAPSLTAIQAVDAIRSGELAAERYVSALLDRCERHRDLNALTWTNPEAMREEAARVDEQRRRGELLGPLAGLPVVVKDNINTVGHPTSSGTPGLKGFFPKADALVVARLREQGALVLAKANMHEMAAGLTSTNLTFGAVANPYDPRRIAGGSSGGTACALAVGMAPAGLGSDTGGSVRMPSAYCGTAGLRPTAFGDRKAYSDDGVVPLVQDLDTIGPMARTVEDVAFLHAAITGAPRATPASLRGLRLGVPRSTHWSSLDAQVETVGGAALAALRDAGVELIEVDLAAVVALSKAIVNGEMSAARTALQAFLLKEGSTLDPHEVVAKIAGADVRALYAGEPGPGAGDVAELRRQILAAYGQAFKESGLAAIVFPTVRAPAPLIAPNGDLPGDLLMVNGRPIDKLEAISGNAIITATLGAPGLSLPMGLDGGGVPLGLELDGLPGADDAVLAIGLAVSPLMPRLPGPPLENHTP